MIFWSLIHSCIHWFREFDIAPFQETYSETFPGQPQNENFDFSSLPLHSKQIFNGKPFQMEGPTIEKAWATQSRSEPGDWEFSPAEDPTPCRRSDSSTTRDQMPKITQVGRGTAKKARSNQRCIAGRGASAVHYAYIQKKEHNVGMRPIRQGEQKTRSRQPVSLVFSIMHRLTLASLLLPLS